MKSFTLLTVAMIMSLSVFVSCSQVKEEAADAIVRVSAPVVAKYGDCLNQAAIEKDFKAQLSEWFKIQQNEGAAKTSITATVCQVAVGAVLPPVLKLGGDQLPAAWECKLTTLNTSVVELAKEACSKLGKKE